jgi:hypothetical protein
LKGQCEQCKELVALELQVAGGGIRARCPACKAEWMVGAARPVIAAPVEQAPPPDATVCPKCGETQAKGAESCRRCGLIFARWNPEVIEELAVPGAAEAWAACEAAWTDEARHEAFIELCRKGGGLPYAAAKYRQRGDADKMARIRTLAEQTLAATPRSEPAKRKTGQYVLILVLMLVLLVLVAKLFVG